MSDGFEHQLDQALDMRWQRHRKEEAKRARSATAIREAHAELERKQTIFHTKVRSLIENAVEHANRHLATRPEKCQLHEVPGYVTGPWYPGGSACNPIAFELRVDGRGVGETLIVELMHQGMVEASLGPFRPTVSEGHATREHYGRPAIPLDRFDTRAAHDLVVRFITAITSRCPLGEETSTT